MVSTVSQQDAVVEDLLKDFTSRFGATTLELARYASLPVVLTPDLVNLLRVNFQPDVSAASDPGVEASLLLSAFCTELGDDLYEMDPDVRRRLLAELLREHGESKLQDVAMLLWEFSKRFSSWANKKNLQWAQQLSALNFIDSEHAQRWLDAAEQQSAHSQTLDRKWFVAMRKELADKRATVEVVLKQMEDESRSQLVQALISAFTSVEKIAPLSYYLTGDSPWGITADTEIDEVADALVRWAESPEKRANLLRFALILNPDNVQLQKQASESALELAFNKAKLLVDQARLMQSEGKLQSARLLLEHAQLISENELGTRHVDTLAITYGLGLLLEVMQENEEASFLFQQAWSAARQSLGNDHPLTKQLADKLPKPEPVPTSTPPIPGIDRFDRFTERARKAIQLALEEAQSFNHTAVGTEHILLGLVREGDGIAARVLNNFGIELHKLRAAVEFIMGRGHPQVLGEIGMTPRAKRVIELAVDEARLLNHHYLGTEHLLLGIIREGQGIAAGIMESLGVSLEKARAQIIEVLKSSPDGVRMSSSRTPYMAAVGTDLAVLAQAAGHAPIVGRNGEIERALQILSRRTKNSLVLVGERHIGKTSIVHGLSIRISDGDVPETLRGRYIISIDMNVLEARSENLAKTEQDLQKALAEIRRVRAILFIDDLRTLFGQGASRLSNLVKVAVMRNEIQLISTATPDEYNRFILQGDPALERQIQQLQVAEPSPEETLNILRGTVAQYEAHHRLKITDEALKAAVTLSARYVKDRLLPDKALDLVDEAASSVRLYWFQATHPSELSEALQELDAISREKVQIVASEDYERAADLREREQYVRKRIARLEEGSSTMGSDDTLYVTTEDVARVVSMWTGIPAADILVEEADQPIGERDTLQHRSGDEVSIKASEEAELTSFGSSGQPPLPSNLLTKRELQVLALMASDSSYKDIASQLQVSVSTVRKHVANILNKLRVHSRLQAVMIGQTWKLINRHPVQ